MDQNGHPQHRLSSQRKDPISETTFPPPVQLHISMLTLSRVVLILSLAASSTSFSSWSTRRIPDMRTRSRSSPRSIEQRYSRPNPLLHSSLDSFSPDDGSLLSKPKATTTKKKNLKTFARYLEVECWRKAELRSLEPVLTAVADACKQISRIVARAMTDDIYGVALGADGLPLAENVQGETQQKLDVLCNTIMLRAFCGSGRSINSVASEEEDEPRCCSDIMGDSAFAIGDFVAVFDPIDGSKNIDASLPVGSIFGIYRVPAGAINDGADRESMFLQRGSALVASGYCLYSATTVLILTLGNGVDGFTLDPDVGQFLHTHRDVRIPSAGPIYSFNEANFIDFDEPVRRYLRALKEGSSSVGVRSNARYIGALVADVHNILINGGIYGYPATKKSPKGKLRLLYESAPMSMIIEQAGGAGSTGHTRILNVKPCEIHQRVPTFLGSVDNVYELDQFYKYYGDDDSGDDENDKVDCAIVEQGEP